MKNVIVWLLIIILTIPHVVFAKSDDDTITRAEFSKIVCELYMTAEHTETLPPPPAGYLANFFDDIPDEHWACKYIDVLLQLGIVSGYGDNKFRPDNEILIEEAIAMLMRITWWSKMAYDRERSTSIYPYGYVAVAEESGLTKDIDFTIGEYATREVLSQLANNALGIFLVEQVSTPRPEILDPHTFVIMDGTNGTQQKTLRTERWGKFVYFKDWEWIIEDE